MIAISFLSFKLNTSLFFSFLFFFSISTWNSTSKNIYYSFSLFLSFFYFSIFFLFLIILYDYFHLSKNSKQLLRKKRSKERSYRASYMYKIYILRVWHRPYVHVCRRTMTNVKRFKVSSSVSRERVVYNKLEKKKKKEETWNLKNEIPSTMDIVISFFSFLDTRRNSRKYESLSEINSVRPRSRQG